MYTQQHRNPSYSNIICKQLLFGEASENLLLPNAYLYIFKNVQKFGFSCNSYNT